MAQVIAGNSHALEQLYDRYARVVYGLSLRMLANADLAEEVVQESFWRVWRRSATFRADQGHFAPWLFGIAHNLCIDELRRRRSRPPAATVHPDYPVIMNVADAEQDVDALTWQAEQQRLIRNALQNLPDDQREVIELAYFGGLSQREIARQLNNPIGTVKTRIRLGLQKIRQFLRDQGVGQEDQ